MQKKRCNADNMRISEHKKESLSTDTLSASIRRIKLFTSVFY